MKIKDLGEDYDLQTVKILVPSTAMQFINNTEAPIMMGYLVSFMDENKGLLMSHEEKGKRKNTRMIEVYPTGGIHNFMEWDIIE